MSRTRPPKAVRSILYIHWKLRYYPSNNPMNYLATNVTKKLDHNNPTLRLLSSKLETDYCNQSCKNNCQTDYNKDSLRTKLGNSAIGNLQ